MYKTLILVALFAVVRADEPELCLCESNDASVWKFLQTLSIDVAEEEEEFFAAIPGELSPLAECNCEKERRKRKVYAADAKVDSPREASLAVDDSPVGVDSPVEVRGIDENMGARKSFKRGSCPNGRVKVGGVCVEVDTLDY